MGAFAVGDVVVVAFPYADFSARKVRPALVVGLSEFDNVITCQITSKPETSKKAIPITDAAFTSGGLKMKSYIRPEKLFTLDLSVIQSKAGVLQPSALEQVKESLREMFS